MDLCQGAVPAAELADLQIDITDAEILADLTWPAPPPGDSSVRTESTAVSEVARVS